MKYERFTERARTVMSLAQEEAEQLNHEFIGTEHILLGLVREGSSTGANVLKNRNVDLPKVRVEVEKLIKGGPQRVHITWRLPLTPRGKMVIDYAREEARNMKFDYVVTEHLLLGLLRENDGVAAQVLRNLGVRPDEVREVVLDLLGGRTDVGRDTE